jgi:lipopolysaccharide assembly outer membrane protein LptD (OstA)
MAETLMDANTDTDLNSETTNYAFHSSNTLVHFQSYHHTDIKLNFIYRNTQYIQSQVQSTYSHSSNQLCSVDGLVVVFIDLSFSLI